MTDPSDRDEPMPEQPPTPATPPAPSVVEAILRLEATVATGLADLAQAIRIHAQATRDAIVAR